MSCTMIREYLICLHFPTMETGINKEGVSLWCG